MFGDFRRPGASINFDNIPGYTPGLSDASDDHNQRADDFPSATSIGGLRISENNVALPQDRFWVGYNHFHNAFAQPDGDISLDRFVFGLEKTFFDGSSSVEFRLPIAASLGGGLAGATEYSGGSYGNLSLLLKHVLFANERDVIAAGIGIETPTGSKSHASNQFAGPVEFTLAPCAVFLAPYIGGMRRFDDTWFANGFLQIDVPTGGDKLSTTINGVERNFLLNQRSFLQIDLGIGAWLLSPSDYDPSGIALTSELHIATAVSQADQFEAIPGGQTPNVFVNQDDSIDTIVNWTSGLHAKFNEQWAVRTGIAVPLINDRIFDTEIMVQLNRAY